MKTEEKQGGKLEKEHLAHFNIAGFTYYDGPEAWKNLDIGTAITAVIDEENKFDARAVALYFEDFKLGYIPRNENRIFYKLLKTGNSIFSLKIQRISKEDHPENQIGVVAHFLNRN